MIDRETRQAVADAIRSSRAQRAKRVRRTRRGKRHALATRLLSLR